MGFTYKENEIEQQAQFEGGMGGNGGIDDFENWLYCNKCCNGIFQYKDLYFYIDTDGVYLEVFRDYYSYDPFQLPNCDRWELVLKSKQSEMIFNFDSLRQDFSIHKPYMMCSTRDCNNIIGRYHQDTKDNQKSSIFSYRLDHTATTLDWTEQPWKNFISKKITDLVVYKFLDKAYKGFNTINTKFYSPTSSLFVQPINIEEQKQITINNKSSSSSSSSSSSTTTSTPGGDNDNENDNVKSPTTTTTTTTTTNNNNNNNNYGDEETLGGDEETPGGDKDDIELVNAIFEGLNNSMEDEVDDENRLIAPVRGSTKLLYKPTITSESRPLIPQFKQVDGMYQIEPRPYQIECYYQCTQKNTLLVLPTGMGKTLIAIMTLLEMYQLNNQDNPEGDTKRVALFLVDRVPLVTQTAQFIEALTDLKVYKLYGEINKKYTRLATRSKKYDVLVSTAQCVVNLLEIACLNICDFYFITFDEVHHATGNHAYNKIIGFIRMSEYPTWPRLLGLSASLISGIHHSSTIESCQSAITKMEDMMLSMVFKPKKYKFNEDEDEDEEDTQQNNQPLSPKQSLENQSSEQVPSSQSLLSQPLEEQPLEQNSNELQQQLEQKEDQSLEQKQQVKQNEDQPLEQPLEQQQQPTEQKEEQSLEQQKQQTNQELEKQLHQNKEKQKQVEEEQEEEELIKKEDATEILDLLKKNDKGYVEIKPQLIEFSPIPQEMFFDKVMTKFLIENSKFIQDALIDYSDVDLESVRNTEFLRALQRLSKRCLEKDESLMYLECQHLIQLYHILTVLSIEGPTQALSALNDFIEQLYKNDTGESQFLINLISLKFEISEFNDSLPKLERLSTRYKCLVQLLNDSLYETIHDNLRILIFVETRFGANNLVKMLKKESFNDILNCKKIVGHNGIGGMSSAKQQRIINKLKDGRCKLLVSTNVLEEGIDIQDLDLVICYDGILSLRSLIQRRGRARSKDKSKFIIIYNDKNDLKILSILSSENLLNSSINSLIQKRKDQDLITSNFKNWKKVYSIIDDIKREEMNSELDGNFDKKYIMLWVYHIEMAEEFKQFLDNYNFDGMEYFVGHVEIVAMKIDDEDQYLSKFIIVTLVGNKNEEPAIISQFCQLLISHRYTFWLMNRSFYLTSATSISLDAIETFPNLLTDDQIIMNNVLDNSLLDDHYLGNGDGNIDENSGLLLSEQIGNLLSASPDSSRLENVKMVFQVKAFEYGNMPSPTEYNRVGCFEGGFELEFYGRLLFLNQNNKWRCILRFQDVEISYLKQECSSDKECIDLIFFVKRPLRFEESQLIPATKNSAERLFWFKSPPTQKANSFGTAFTYKFSISKKERIKELLGFFTVYGFKVFDSNIKINTKPIPPLSFSHYFIGHHKDISYLLQCLDSQRSFGRIITQGFVDMISQLLTEGKQEESKFIILALIANKVKFIDYKKFIVSQLCYFNRDSYLEKRNLLTVASGEFSWIREIVRTPSRVIYIEPRLQRSCRAIRKFGPDNFVVIKFTDEAKVPMQGINKRHPVFSIIRNVFANGINVDGQNYSFVGNSNSQLRDYAAWLVSDKIGPRAVRHWTEINHVDNARKFFRCMGLMFSTTLPTVRIFQEHYHLKKDIERNKHCFTEGCGEIGSQLAMNLNETYNFNPSTCAYQIRIGGVKGMFVVNNKLDDPLGVYLRPSMVKFFTKDTDEHRTLEICSISTTSKCKLNRQVISLLSTLGTKDSVFFSLQDRYLNQLANIVNDVETSRQLLNEFFPDITESELYQDTYIRRILITLYKLKMERIQQKCSIEIEKSRNLLGVADPTETLEENTVYVQIEEDDPIDGHKYSVVITGLVMVIKNPCTHPGDVRYLTAVDNPEIKHLRNVLVFSTKGKVPNFKEISGSDLDGDRYFFCYDKQLIGDRKQSYEAYLGDEKGSKANKCEPGNVYKNTTLLVDMYFINVERQQLGTMYNAHLAICDSKGATHELAIEISKECFKEIDYAKTGIHGNIPKEANDLLTKQGYPHFMRKELSTKDYYQSKTVMGLMYDQIDQLVYIGDFLPDIVVDESLLVQGFQSYLEDAYILYREYKLQVHSLLQRYGSESEESLMIGFFDHGMIEEKLSRDVKSEMKNTYKKIQQMFENEFLKDFCEEQREITLLKHYDKIEKKIAAWYFVSYNDKDPNRVLGFYWIARSFKKMSQDEDHKKKRNIMVNSILNHMEVKRIDTLPLYQERLNVTDQLAAFLISLTSSIFAVSTLEMVGSSANLLFDQDSDISLYLNIKDLNGLRLTYDQKLEIINQLRDELKASRLELKHLDVITAKSINHPKINPSGNVTDQKRRQLQNLQKVPVLKFKLKDYQISIHLDELQWQETIIQQAYLEKDPFIISLLFCLIDWGVKSSFIPTATSLNSDTNTSPIATTITKDKNLNKSNLFSLFIQFCIENKLIEKIDDVRLFRQHQINIKQYGSVLGSLTSNKSVEWWDSIIEVASRYFFIERAKNERRNLNRGTQLNDTDTYYNTTGLGDMLLSFFRYYSDKFGNCIYEGKIYNLVSLTKGYFSSSIDPNYDENKSTLLFYQESFRHALHSLSTFISMEDFLSNCYKSKKKTMFIKKNQLEKLRQEKEKIIRRVKLCGCKISIANINLDKGIIEIEGIPQHLRMAQNEIRDLLAIKTSLADIESSTIKNANSIMVQSSSDNNNNGGYRDNNFLNIKSNYKNNKSIK